MSSVRLSAASERVGLRFERGARIGAGGQGEVWAATDTLTGEAAVLKVVARADPLARTRFRREVASLRGVRVPGVARLLDAGEEEDGLWLAMERVKGRPFPGPLPRRWDALVPCVEALLGALAAVHRLGLVHRDLKPANVLVTAQGQPVIVDFGLSGAAGRGEPGVGTPRYQAPEQAAGEEVDARADLYAVGKMLLEVLDADPALPESVATALLPWIAEDREDRPASAGEALRALGMDGRERVAARVDRLLPEAEVLSAEALQGLFSGHERVLHLKSDGAVALWRRTGGRRDRVVAVLAAWVREGLARWEGEGLALPREALDALETGGWTSGDAAAAGLLPEDAAWLPWMALLGSDARLDRLAALRPEAAPGLSAALSRLVAQEAVLMDGDTPRVLAWPPGFRARLLPVPRAEAARRAAVLLPEGARLRHQVHAGVAPAALAREAEAVAVLGLQEGRPAGTISALELALPGLRRAKPRLPAAEIRLLKLWARASLSLGTPRDLDRALFELGRGPEGLEPVRTLLRGARRSVDGDGAGALGILEAISSIAEEGPDEDLEIWRAAMCVHAARRCAPSRELEALEGLGRWAEARPAREAALAGWWGTLRYRQERYVEAANLHERSAEGKTALSGQRSSWLNAAGAWLEQGDLPRAAALAERVLRSAEASRHAIQTLEAERLYRAATLRQAGAAARHTPDLALVAVAFDIGRPANGAVTALGEAALAFRQGDAPMVAALALRARRGFEQEHMAGPALLCGALALALEPDPAEAVALIAVAETVAAPGLAVQAAALAAWTDPSAAVQAAAGGLVRRQAVEVRAPAVAVQEVLSLAEIAVRLGLLIPGTENAFP